MESSVKSKSQSQFLEEVFWPSDSKSLRLRRSEAFEMQLSHDIWGSSLKYLPTVYLKTVSSVLRESM